MSDYIGKKCLICGEAFKAGDDIVVCPECGTPYHRSCYQKEGKCINTVLHNNNQSWNEAQQKASEEENGSADTIKCSVCGEENSSQSLFCNKCGSPLSNSKETDNSNPQGQFGQVPPFISQMMESTDQKKFTPESDIDGIKLKEYGTYVGANPFYYMTHFIRFGKFNRKVSINLSAFLFPELYFLYRKMYFVGILVYVLRTVLAIPLFLFMVKDGYFDGTILVELFKNTFSKDTLDLLITISRGISTTLLFACSLGANYLYYHKARKDILSIHDETADENEQKDRIAKKGGVSLLNCFIAAAVPFVVMMIVMAIGMVK